MKRLKVEMITVDEETQSKMDRVVEKWRSKSSLDKSIQKMDKLLDGLDTSKLPSASEQLKDI